jgi:hypothetical protein
MRKKEISRPEPLTEIILRNFYADLSFGSNSRPETVLPE